MRKLFFPLLCMGVLVAPIGAFAHGGVEKIVGDTMVFLNQTPLAPFVGEQVHLPFVLTNNKNNTPLNNIPVEVTVTDTYLGDESKDKLLYTTTMSTDVNGVLDFSYTFPRENYFDIDLHFTDSTGSPQETGFLVQARDKVPSAVPLKREALFFVLGMIVGSLGIFLYEARKASFSKVST